MRFQTKMPRAKRIIYYIPNIPVDINQTTMKHAISLTISLIISCTVLHINAFSLFVGTSQVTTLGQSPSLLHLSSSPIPFNDTNINFNSNTESPRNPINPSSEFGTPLNESTRTFNKAAIGFIKNALFDTLFTSDSFDRKQSLSRSFARFYALETIARMPYFSYLSVLHLYETLGLWRRASYLKLHFSESWNELHHLLIMEELGGNQKWSDKFFAQHIAFFYYWFVVVCYMANPTLAYNLNQSVEEHAYETYDHFLNEFEVELKEKEVTEVAKRYYRDGDVLFDAMHTCSGNAPSRRPKLDNLYDVFMAIRDDEREHVRTMEYLQEQEADIDLCNV